MSTRVEAGTVSGLHYTNGYTVAPLQGFVHHARRLTSRARQHVGVGAQGDRYGGVPEALLDDLGMRVLAEKERGARVPEVVGAGLLGQLCAPEGPLEGPNGRGPWAHRLARVAGEAQVALLPQRAETQALPVLGRLLANFSRTHGVRGSACRAPR